MNAVCKDIFRSIHEGKWLYIEYQNINAVKTKYWISIKNINIEEKSLNVIGLHLGYYTTKELKIYIDQILTTQLLDGTFYQTNKELLEDIEAFPEKYTSIFTNVINLKTLNYLSDCNKLADIPKLNDEFYLIRKLDADKISNGIYQLDEEQFKLIVNSFKKVSEIKKERNINTVIQLALNVLSVYTPKGLYVLAYKEVKFDIIKKTLFAAEELTICTEFSPDGTNKLSIQNFLDPEEIEMLNFYDKIQEISELIKDSITAHLKKQQVVDDRPYFISIQRNPIINLEREYEAIINMYSDNNPTIPIQAFFGELHSVKQNKEILPIAVIDKNVNLDQMLAIHNAINNPVAYIQGPPGTVPHVTFEIFSSLSLASIKSF